jgi:FkbM family methyltransferase
MTECNAAEIWLQSVDGKLENILAQISNMAKIRDRPQDVSTETLNVLHTALFGWPMDDLTPKSELFACASLRDAAMILLASDRFKWDSREALPLWPEDKWICTEAFGLRMWINLHDNFVSWGVLRNDWENADVQFAVNLLEEGDGFVDVGANVGVYTLQAARKVGPTGMVYAFEPQPDVCEMLKRSVTDNGFLSRVTVHQSGVGSEDRKMRIWRQDHKNQGASRMARDEEITGGISNSVWMTKLDSVVFLRPIRVLKVDIEGYEPLMLEGAQGFFRRHKPIVLTEFFPNAIRCATGLNPAEYITRWTDLGYRIHMFEEGRVGEPFRIEDVGRYDATDALLNIVCVPEGVDAQQLQGAAEQG